MKDTKKEDLFEYISATRIRLRRCSPFFAALSLYAEIEFTEEIPIAATDGRKIFFHPENYIKLPPIERDGVYLHELLHMALLHNFRKGVRDHRIFNIAADIVINGMIENEGKVKIPSFGIRNKDLEHLSVEEIYEILIKKSQKFKDEFSDLIYDNSSINKEGADNLKDSNCKSEKEIRAYWKQAINDSKLIAKSAGQKVYPGSFDRNLGEITEPEIDWKIKLFS